MKEVALFFNIHEFGSHFLEVRTEEKLPAIQPEMPSLESDTQSMMESEATSIE